jgi:hypothetical protein
MFKLHVVDVLIFVSEVKLFNKFKKSNEIYLVRILIKIWFWDNILRHAKLIFRQAKFFLGKEKLFFGRVKYYTLKNKMCFASMAVKHTLINK